jgi:hypothetical protein
MMAQACSSIASERYFKSNTQTDMAFAIPSCELDIPVLSPSAGDKNAYLDPNSPDAIIRKATAMRAQACVDTMYDVKPAVYHTGEPIKNLPPKPPSIDGFFDYKATASVTIPILLVFILALFIILVSRKSLRRSGKICVLICALLLMAVVIYIYTRNE